MPSSNRFLAFLVLACGLNAACAQGPDARAPNVLFIFIDDQGYYDLSSYGADEVNTPRIDALAQNGVRFTDYYAAAPICSPSRAALLTGKYPRRTGNEIWVHRPDASWGIPPAEITIAELFRDAGYATAAIGKWHLGFKDEFLPLNQGFDHYYGILHNLDSFETVHFEADGGTPLQRGNEIIQRDTPPEHLVRLYTDEAISWIESNLERNEGNPKPFFLYMPHTMLHNPLGVSEEFKGSSEWGEYGDAIQELDFHVGRLVDALDSMGIRDETIIVYASDNGRGPGRKAGQPIRGSKLGTLEGGLRVPAIISGPAAGIEAGLTTDVMAHAMDWYPTLASLAGIDIPDDIILDGRDLSALLTGKTDTTPAFEEGVSINAEVPLRRPLELDAEWAPQFTQEEYLNAFFYHGATGALAAVRSGDWKLHLNPELTLYNLADDPGESTPVTTGRLRWKLRGMAVQFQREMNEYARSR